MNTNKMALNLTNDEFHDAYENMLKVLAQAAYDKSCEWATTEPKILFRTNTDNMYKAYLGFFKEGEERQHYTCSACAHFFHRFADVVYVENDKIHSVYWDENLIEDEFFKEMVKYFRTQVESGKIILPLAKKPDAITIDSIKLDSDRYHVYGYSHLGGFNHFHFALNPDGIAYAEKYTTEEAASAYYKRAVWMLKTRWEDDVLKKALNMAKAGDLNNKDSEATLEAFIKIKDAANNKSNATLWNFVYKYVDLLDHFNGSVEGSLLDDIADGYSDKYAISRFNAKMEPDKYMRPKSDPTAANVAEAERIVAELGLADSLKRKLCPLDEVPTFIWKQKKEENKTSNGSIFGSVKTKDNNKSIDSKYESKTAKPISLQSFINKILPEAKSISVDCNRYGHYFQYMTEEIAGSKPILKYDSVDARNPISLYTYTHPVISSTFNIKIGYNNVVAIIPHPEYMFSKENHGVLFVLEKCYDTFIHAKGGLALFPEILISELYPVRKTIESYSNDNKIPKPDPDIQYAAGVYYSGRAGNIEVLVDTGDIKTKYIITCIE